MSHSSESLGRDWSGRSRKHNIGLPEKEGQLVAGFGKDMKSEETLKGEKMEGVMLAMCGLRAPSMDASLVAETITNHGTASFLSDFDQAAQDRGSLQLCIWLSLEAVSSSI